MAQAVVSRQTKTRGRITGKSEVPVTWEPDENTPGNRADLYDGGTALLGWLLVDGVWVKDRPAGTDTWTG
jgi:hypothetical protein